MFHLLYLLTILLFIIYISYILYAFATFSKILIKTRLNLSSLFIKSVILYNQNVHYLYAEYNKISRCKGTKKAIISLLNVKEIHQFIDNNYVFLSQNYHDKLIFYVTEKYNTSQIYKNIKYSIIDISDIFYKFPYKFNESMHTPNFMKRGKWNYQHMCRFFFRDIFLHPSLCDVDLFLRLDSDSILNTTLNLYNYMRNNIYYMHNRILNDAKSVVKEIKEYITSFVDNIKPNIKDRISYNMAFRKTALMYYNNFEICRLSFFRSKDMFIITNLIDYSHGQFLYRWGDAPLRFITLSIFLEKCYKLIIPHSVIYYHQSKKYR